MCGGHPLSHRRRQYHGRSRGLTSLFGMGRGEHPCYNRHQLFVQIADLHRCLMMFC